MANHDRREALRGAEEDTLDLLSEILTGKQWAELLKAPLELAARQGNRGLAQKLVVAGGNIRQAAHEAVRGDHEDVVRDLLEGKAHPDATDTDGNTLLDLAARGGKTGMVQLVMREGAGVDEVDNQRQPPFFVAVDGGRMAAALAPLPG